MKRCRLMCSAAALGVCWASLAVGQGSDSSLNGRFLKAVEKNDLTTVTQLLEKGVDIETRSEGGYTALIEASAMGHIELVKALLEKGASSRAKEDRGNTALCYGSSSI